MAICTLNWYHPLQFISRWYSFPKNMSKTHSFKSKENPIQYVIKWKDYIISTLQSDSYRRSCLKPFMVIWGKALTSSSKAKVLFPFGSKVTLKKAVLKMGDPIMFVF